MSKFLVAKTTSYYDGHGTPDDGGTEVFITDNPDYKLLSGDLSFRDMYDAKAYYKLKEELAELDPGSEEALELIDEMEDLVQDENNLSAQDGYNCTTESYSVKEISDEEVEKYTKILNDYKEMLVFIYEKERN